MALYHSQVTLNNVQKQVIYTMDAFEKHNDTSYSIIKYKIFCSFHNLKSFN